MAVDGHIVLKTDVDTTGVTTSANSIKQAFSSVAKKMAVAFTTRYIKQFVAESKQLYQQQMEAELKLATIVKQRTGATDDQVRALYDLASAQQKLGVIGDEVQLSGLQQLATFTNQTDSLESLLPAMNNLLAQQKGLNASSGDAVNIGNLMGKVLQGQTSALKRVGISFSEAEEEVLKYGNESERAAMLAKVITNNVGNMNSALAQTDSGKQQQLANRLGDVKEKTGQIVYIVQSAFLPAIETLIIGLEKLFNLFGLSNDETLHIAENEKGTSDNTSDILGDEKAITKELKKQLASYDEINQITKETAETTESTETSGGKQKGFGEKVPEETTSKVKKILGTILTIVGGAMLAVGLILLLFVPTKAPLGFGLMLAGIGVLGVSAATLNWNEMPEKTKKIIRDITEIAGVSMLAIGVFLCLTAQYAWGVAAIIGGLSLETTAAIIDWDDPQKTTEEKANSIMKIAEGALLAIGLVLCLTGHYGWGAAAFVAALMLMGKTELGITWDSLYNAMQGPVGDIIDLVSGASLAIGLMLCLSGHIPAGIAMLSAAATAQYGKASLSGDSFIDWLKKQMNGLISFVNSIVDLINEIWQPFSELLTPIARIFGYSGPDRLPKIPHIPYYEISQNQEQEAETNIAAKLRAAQINAGTIQAQNVPTNLRSTYVRYGIPGLAKGAVLPANKPFLAELGDQKNGRNLEAPESLLREIYAEGNAETNALLQQLIQVMKGGMTVNVDGQQLMRINRDAETRSGSQTVTGGFAHAY